MIKKIRLFGIRRQMKVKKYNYKKVNAFTSGESKGNPAAYLLVEDSELSHEIMLEVGKEHAGFVSEVIFCANSSKADLKLTYYSSECEVDFCGHGTIAVMYDQIKCNEELRAKSKVMIETNKKGTLAVYNCITDEDAVYITAPKAKHLKVPETKEQIAIALGILQSDISVGYPIDFIDAGLKTLIVPINEFDKEISIFPRESELKRFCICNGIDIILIFSKSAGTCQYMAHTRVFAPKYGYLEDPATGSGNSAFGNYLLKNNLWNDSPIAIEQGNKNINFNTVKLKQKEGEILFGGKATVRIDGQYYI
jgi:PhzF family phenazine biosynthesis protein